MNPGLAVDSRNAKVFPIPIPCQLSTAEQKDSHSCEALRGAAGGHCLLLNNVHVMVPS